MGKRRVVLYGNSVIIGTVGTSLRRSPQYEVIPFSPVQQNELEALAPDVVLFDLEAAQNEAVFSLLARHPALLLIGLCPDTNLVKMWAGRQMVELTTKGLVEAISKQLMTMEGSH